MELMKASHQWRTRPSDQRFLSLTDLNAFVRNARDRSTGKVVSSRGLTAQPIGTDHQGIEIVGPNGGPCNVTNWAFGQIAQRAGAPAGYLRELPAELAADCVNYGLKIHRDIEDLGVLTYKADDNSPTELRAVTGPNYGRIWNSTITQALVDRFGDGITGDFRVPGEFGEIVDVTKENTTLYASDRDMFVFLADEKNRITLPGRRAGQAGDFARGFFVWNSEVGAQSFGIAMFLFDYTCRNRIVWGATEYSELRIRHTASAPDKWIEEAMPAIEAYSEAKTDVVINAIEQARKTKLDDKLDEFLAKRFTRAEVTGIKAAHMSDEQRPIETLWDVATGVTAYARGIQWQDRRVELERQAGKVLDLAA